MSRLAKKINDKGVSNMLWFVAAMVIVLLLIVLSTIILNKGEGYAIGAIDDIFLKIGDSIG